MRLKETLLGTMAAIAMTGAAQADYVSPTGWYMSLGAGANWIQDGDFRSIGDGTALGELQYSTGYIVSGAVGYDFGRNWRVEFEVAYRDNDVDNRCYDGFPCSEAVEQVWELSQMFNVLYDIPLGGNWEASAGAGIGGNLVVLKEWVDLEMDDYVLAGQLLAQVGYRFADRWQVYADYRYMIVDDPSMADLSDPGGRQEIEKSEHALLVGLRFDLQRDGAAPPPRHTPSSAPKQFIVFFGFNKSNLTSEAARVVSEAAAAAKEYGSASITVVGHTDTVGSNDYNLRLSMARSQSVKEGLIGNGIAASMISTGGRGEAELMVQTGDSVKEPQNRRATIDLN
jgi:OOP family OmpA-OmpF porin